MALLEDLPDELVFLVVEYLTHPSLSRFSLVNRRFHSLTIPSLYATFAGPKAQQFLRTITTSPLRYQHKIAERVKKVQWRAYIKKVIDPTAVRAKIKRCIPASQRQPVLETYRKFCLKVPGESSGPPLDVHFAKSLIPVEQWFLDFFLSFVPNVEDVEIHDAWHWDHQTRWFTHLAVNGERFKFLKTVVIHGPMRLNNIIPLLTIPTLRSLELDLVMDLDIPRDSRPPWPVAPDMYGVTPNSLALERLAIKRSYILTEILCTLLDSIKSLKSFAYEHKRHKLSYPREFRLRVDYPRLGKALARHSNTLTSLRLHDKYDSWLTGLQHLLSILPNLEELEIRLPHDVAHAVIQTPHQPSQIDLAKWLDSYFPSSPLHTLKLRCGSTSSSSFSKNFQNHCNATTCRQFTNESALNSVTVLRALAKHGLRRVCVAFSLLDRYSWQSFQHTKGVYQSAGLEIEVVDYYDSDERLWN